jgi:hypothetical protein
MKPLIQLRAQLAAGEFEFTEHALRRAVERDIADREIREAGAVASLVEDYPADKFRARPISPMYVSSPCMNPTRRNGSISSPGGTSHVQVRSLRQYGSPTGSG